MRDFGLTAHPYAPTSQPAIQPGVRRSWLRLVRRGLFYVLLIALAFSMLFPFLWTVSASFKGDQAVLVTPPQLIPSTLQWDNYLAVAQQIDITQLLQNS